MWQRKWNFSKGPVFGITFPLTRASGLASPCRNAVKDDENRGSQRFYERSHWAHEATGPKATLSNEGRYHIGMSKSLTQFLLVAAICWFGIAVRAQPPPIPDDEIPAFVLKTLQRPMPPLREIRGPDGGLIVSSSSVNAQNMMHWAGIWRDIENVEQTDLVLRSLLNIVAGKTDASKYCRARALTYLSRNAPKRLVPSLIEILKQDEGDSSVRSLKRVAMGALKTMRADAIPAINEISKQLHSPNPINRLCAVECLAEPLPVRN